MASAPMYRCRSKQPAELHRRSKSPAEPRQSSKQPEEPRPPVTPTRRKRGFASVATPTTSSKDVCPRRQDVCSPPPSKRFLSTTAGAAAVAGEVQGTIPSVQWALTAATAAGQPSHTCSSPTSSTQSHSQTFPPVSPTQSSRSVSSDSPQDSSTQGPRSPSGASPLECPALNGGSPTQVSPSDSPMQSLPSSARVSPPGSPTPSPRSPTMVAPAPEMQAPRIVGREEERARLGAFLGRCFDSAEAGGDVEMPAACGESAGSGRARSLYVSGGPGTGKTCCARAAMAELAERMPQLRRIEVNCMNMSQRTVPGLFRSIAEICGGADACRDLRGRSGQGLLVAMARQLKKIGAPVVLLVDEVDQLVRKSAADATSACALEALFSLPVTHGAPIMAVVAIANAVDLLERPAASPLARGIAESMLFEPYTATQLRDIFKARLEASEQGAAVEHSLGKVGIELRVRQVAKQSGDCRRLLSLFHQAVFDADAAFTPAGMSAGDAAVAQTSQPSRGHGATKVGSDPLMSVAQLPMEQQVLMCTFAEAEAETLRSSEVCTRYKDLCRRLHQPLNLATKGHINAALSALQHLGLLGVRAAGARGRGPARPVGGDLVAELAVSRKALRQRIAKANPLLEKCLHA
mmetsp:Transcript_36038/g.99380  ORF Transcript_36038/g.99380 Transcript_36038/m.99380 type:complete len:634 (-) Transcript_36038:462-2363(-)